MRYVIILILLALLLVNCDNKSANKDCCKSDSLDYILYSTLIDKYVTPEIDSCMTIDSKTEKIVLLKNKRRNLLLIDSTKVYNKYEKDCFKYLTIDSLLYDNFVTLNKTKCKLDSFSVGEIRFHKMSKFLFNKSLRDNMIKGYDDLYVRFSDVAGIVEFSRISYNNDKTQALVEICLYRSPKNSFGIFVWLKLVKGQWIIFGEKNDWIS